MFPNWNDFNWSTKSFWHNKPQNLVQEIWSYRFFWPMYTMVLVISLWTNILLEKKSQLSDYGKISCDVPPATIFGPLTFLIYVNDMPQAMQMTHVSCTNIEMSKKLKNNSTKILKMIAILLLTIRHIWSRSVLFASKRKIKNGRKLNVEYKNVKNKTTFANNISWLCLIKMELCLGSLCP